MELDELHADLSAFADEEDDVAVDPNGQFVLMRHGHEIAGQLVEDENGRLLVRREGVTIPYRTFVRSDLAGLQQFADRLLARRSPVDAYVDGRAEVQRPAEPLRIGGAQELLRRECEETPPFTARVSFITADAGHGKTALLRQFQQQQAARFAAGQANYLFWHVDLQGRQLLRLSEALMGDLGDLRITGLWMPSIIRLMRHKALVLGVDGFDELAAEQGSTDALGALANLVTQLGGRGTVVAAARRTFFDTDDYLRRAGVMGRALSNACEFTQISLLPWRREENIAYLNNVRAPASQINSSSGTLLDETVKALGGDHAHPMITRPFLFTQAVRAITTYGISPAEFIRGADDPMSGVAAVVQAFVRREVADKWKTRETGEPYLTELQHMQLLADVAEEMYRSQKDRLPLDVVETITILLMDQWAIEPERRQQIIEMVRMHVLLVRPSGDSEVRAFDHPEFRDYFIAYALRSHLDRVMEGTPVRALAQFLSIAQISDSTARYVCSMLERTSARVQTLLLGLQQALEFEWKPTFLQINTGTLLGFVLSDLASSEDLHFEGRAIFSSLVFERSRLSRVRLRGGLFVNASLGGADWRSVSLDDCQLGELVLDSSSRFEDVVFTECTIEGLKVRSAGEEEREYTPKRVWARLGDFGIREARQGTLVPTVEAEPDGEAVRVFRRFLRLFNRSTVVTDEQLRARFRPDQRLVFEDLIPLMERFGVISEEKWKGAGQKRIWTIRVRPEDIQTAEGGSGDTHLVEFWAELRPELGHHGALRGPVGL